MNSIKILVLMFWFLAPSIGGKTNEPFCLENASNLTLDFLYNNFIKKDLKNSYVNFFKIKQLIYFLSNKCKLIVQHKQYRKIFGTSFKIGMGKLMPAGRIALAIVFYCALRSKLRQNFTYDIYIIIEDRTCDSSILPVAVKISPP